MKPTQLFLDMMSSESVQETLWAVTKGGSYIEGDHILKSRDKRDYDILEWRQPGSEDTVYRASFTKTFFFSLHSGATAMACLTQHNLAPHESVEHVVEFFKKHS
jgi:hypothetical protein